jgi:hypothetical protein
MEVTFVAEAGRTRLTIVQSGFPTAEVRDGFAEGRASILDGLGCAVAPRVTGSSMTVGHHPPGRAASGSGWRCWPFRACYTLWT